MPSMTTGFRLARAVYTAAVRPAGPDPMMMMSRRSVVTTSLSAPAAPSGGRDASRVPSGPQQPPDDHEDSAEREPRGPDLALVQGGEGAEKSGDEQHRRGDDEQGSEQAVRDGLAEGLRRPDCAIASERDRSFNGIRGVGRPVAHESVRESAPVASG